MILYVEKIHAIKFQQLMMVPFGNTKMHHNAIWEILGEIIFFILGHLLWTFILDNPRLWHVVQSNSTTWHNNFILGKKSNDYLFQ
jgi:hypothetical protein